VSAGPHPQDPVRAELIEKEVALRLIGQKSAKIE